MVKKVLSLEKGN